jgi:hypothetical protein
MVILWHVGRRCAWGKQHQSDFCSHVGLLALASVARFVLLLVCLIGACAGVCCYNKPSEGQATSAPAVVVIQPGAPAAVGQPVYAQPAVVVANAQPQQVAVVCPEGCAAGTMLEVNINGKPMSVAVPQGVVPGQQFLVSAP